MTAVEKMGLRNIAYAMINRALVDMQTKTHVAEGWEFFKSGEAEIYENLMSVDRKKIHAKAASLARLKGIPEPEIKQMEVQYGNC